MLETLVRTTTLAATLLGPEAPLPLASNPPATGQVAPPVAGTLLDGTAFDLASMRGQVVLVDFWATWCEPCKLSMPRYVALEKKLAGKGFRMLAVSVDEDAEVLKRFVAAMKLTLSILHDAGAKIVERYAPPAMPTAYLIGRDGKIAWIHKSFAVGDEAKVEAAVLEALARPAP